MDREVFSDALRVHEGLLPELLSPEEHRRITHNVVVLRARA